MRRLLSFFLFCAALTLHAADFRTPLDGGWSFALGDAASMEADFAHGTQYFTYLTKVRSNGDDHGPAALDFIEDDAWHAVTLPHDWVVDLPYDGAASHSHGYK